jgi:hypothetical protein
VSFDAGPDAAASGRRARPTLPEAAEDTPSFTIEAPSIGPPQGGGALRGIDEQFTVNASNGTATLSLGLPFTPSRDGFVPPGRLSYDAAAGNGVFGLGWTFDPPSVRRRTDWGVPTYTPADTFSFAGGDDLVPAHEWDSEGEFVYDPNLRLQLVP